MHSTLRECFRYEKLIGDNDVDESLELYSKNLLHLFVTKSLVYFPNSRNVIDTYIIAVGDLFDDVIISNEIPITDMPASHQVLLMREKDEEITKYIIMRNNNMVKASYLELEEVITLLQIPVLDDFLRSSELFNTSYNSRQYFESGQSQILLISIVIVLILEHTSKILLFMELPDLVKYS